MRVNYLAVLASAVAIFALGGLWYSPLLFAKRWMALMGKSEAELKAAGPSPGMFVQVFLCGLLTAWSITVVVTHFAKLTPLRGALIGGFCWLGLAAATSYGTALFSGKPKQLWLIDSSYNLVSFVLAGVIAAVWG